MAKKKPSASVGSVAYRYRCTIVRWLDGDSCDVSVDVGFSITLHMRIRVYGINCPEVHSRNLKEKAAGLAALSEAQKLCIAGSVVWIQSHKSTESDKFGRWLAEITLTDGSDFATSMVAAGVAKLYFGVGVKPT